MGKKIQAAAYNGARTVYCVENQICIESSTYVYCIKHNFSSVRI